MNDKVIVFDTARYMIEDGPGIRNAVFFKGCPLRCRWCSNPFGLSSKKRVAFNSGKCSKCGKCAFICPTGAIKMDPGRMPVTDHSICTACGACADACVYQARTMVGKEMTVSDVMHFITTDIPYFNRSGGGITLSGGEVLSQAEMAIKILAACKDRMIHRAIETSGYGKWEDLKKILALVNVAFIDLKHIDPAIHKELTGVDNRIILENIRKAAAFCLENNIELIIRIPVIPNLNDSEDNLRQSAQFVASLEGDLQINLLPFHTLGESKYEMIGEPYSMAGAAPPENNAMAKHKDLIESCGCPCTVGGGNVRYKGRSTQK